MHSPAQFGLFSWAARPYVCPSPVAYIYLSPSCTVILAEGIRLCWKNCFDEIVNDDLEHILMSLGLSSRYEQGDRKGYNDRERIMRRRETMDG